MAVRRFDSYLSGIITLTNQLGVRQFGEMCNEQIVKAVKGTHYPQKLHQTICDRSQPGYHHPIRLL